MVMDGEEWGFVQENSKWRSLVAPPLLAVAVVVVVVVAGGREVVVGEEEASSETRVKMEAVFVIWKYREKQKDASSLIFNIYDAINNYLLIN